MKQIYGIWFPEHDEHFTKVMNPDGSYQKDTFDIAMSYIKTPKIFYDIGAHVGLWSLMAHKVGFEIINSYEPNPRTFACLKKNLRNKASLYKYGISCSNNDWFTKHADKKNSGAVYLDNIATSHGVDHEKVCIQRADESNLHLLINGWGIKPHESLVKIDTEGMEADCILGMDKIIYALRPVVCVEQKSNKDALDILQKMGMQIVQQVRKDYILTWKNQ